MCEDEEIQCRIIDEPGGRLFHWCSVLRKKLLNRSKRVTCFSNSHLHLLLSFPSCVEGFVDVHSVSHGTDKIFFSNPQFVIRKITWQMFPFRRRLKLD